MSYRSGSGGNDSLQMLLLATSSTHACSSLRRAPASQLRNVFDRRRHAITTLAPNKAMPTQRTVYLTFCRTEVVHVILPKLPRSSTLRITFLTNCSAARAAATGSQARTDAASASQRVACARRCRCSSRRSARVSIVYVSSFKYKGQENFAGRPHRATTRTHKHK